MTQYDAHSTTRWQQVVRVVWRIGFILAVALVAKFGMDWLSAQIAVLESDTAAQAMIGLIVALLVGYAILLAIPFVPGVEIGIAILMIQGAQAAPFVYLATVSGLSLAFCIGQYVPLERIIRLCRDLYLPRVATLLERIATTPRVDRLQAMHDRLPRWLAPALCDYRYVTLGLAINLPGNMALGGGGGIVMAGGISRLFLTRFALLTIALATLPVPLAVWLLGTDILH